ncbi:S-layer homology domain-containing protein [Pseudoflavonifractor phocaeensis]|uniref:S-layer homology domain-containing protein n=1 Tax=Pseudoflavonifractor phocaeensis TaxID=1870988 RepID=UPI001F3704A2|nr:S-layer homology domain-containing protein [Pseudoflavonifractor phocaeensis]MCF2660916.1 S-layer homology domain-containing protein [Pseudoflavonifractor phocaeensis]
MKKKLISLALTAAMMVGIMASSAFAADVRTFSDVPTDHWACSAIEEMASRGIVSGVGEGKFAPNGEVTTAQFATMMVRAFFPDELAANTKEYDTWYGSFLHIALENELLTRQPAIYTYEMVNGREQWDSKYVNNGMSRKNMAMMLANYLMYHLDLNDVYEHMVIDDIPDYDVIDNYGWQYNSAISMVYKLGCMSGIDSAGTFDGEGKVTRAQACVVLRKAMELVSQEAGKPVNNTDVWWYMTFHTPDYWLNAGDKDAMEGLTPDVRLKNGKTITPEHIQEVMYSLKSKYPEGMLSGDDNYFYYDEYGIAGASGCAAFGSYVVEDIFGVDQSSRLSYHAYSTSEEDVKNAVFDWIRPGDYVRINESHSVVVLEKNENSIVVVEGNYRGKVHWGREITKAALEKGDYWVSSGYPYLPE